MLGPRWPNVEPTGPTLGQSGANEVCWRGRPIHPHIDILTHLHLVPHMRRWSGSALVQVMAWRLFGTKPLPEPTLIVNWTVRDNLQWNLSGNRKNFIHENAFANVVCENGGHFVRGRWVDMCCTVSNLFLQLLIFKLSLMMLLVPFFPCSCSSQIKYSFEQSAQPLSKRSLFYAQNLWWLHFHEHVCRECVHNWRVIKPMRASILVLFLS